MRRVNRLWASGIIIALGATSASAQTLPKRLLQVPNSLIAKAPPKLAPIVGTLRPPLAAIESTVRTLPTDAVPLLTQPLRQTSKLIGTVTGSPLVLGAPVRRAPLLAPILAHTDMALNQVHSPSFQPGPSAAPTLINARAERLVQFANAARSLVDRDPSGELIVRGRILLIDPRPIVLRRARAQGFSVLSEDRDPVFEYSVVTLGTPRGLSAVAAMNRLRAFAPNQAADFDHLYQPAGGSLGRTADRAAVARASTRPIVGMIDGGVASHPSLIGRIAEQRGFAGAARATGHGTAIASLLVGSDGAFRGAARGASLLVADVYGGNRSAGSASRIAQALSWLVSKRPQVINISLVGPPNALLKRAIDAARARGISIVAAVGNDGPAAAPQYPASYPSVLAVTGVDHRGIALFESGNAVDLDFAAPGADMAAARPGKGYVRVRGTSFAAALAAGRLALVGSPVRLAAEAKPGKGRVGRGIVCLTCRVPPAAVAAR